MPRRLLAGDVLAAGCASTLAVEAVVHPRASPADAAAAAAALHGAYVELTVVDSVAFLEAPDLAGHRRRRRATGRGRKGRTTPGGDEQSFFHASSADDDLFFDDDLFAASGTSRDDDDEEEDDDEEDEEDEGEEGLPLMSMAEAAAAAFAAADADTDDDDDDDDDDDESSGFYANDAAVDNPAARSVTRGDLFSLPALGVLSVAAAAAPTVSASSMAVLAASLASEGKSAPIASLPVLGVSLPVSSAVERLARSRRQERVQAAAAAGGRGRGQGRGRGRGSAAASADDDDEDKFTVTLRLVARVVTSAGARVPGTVPAVSPPFVVVSRRAKALGLHKVEFPSPDDQVTAIEHVGRETSRRLSALAAAVRARKEQQQKPQQQPQQPQQQPQQPQQPEQQQQQQQQDPQPVAFLSPQATALAELLPADVDLDLGSLATVRDLLRLASAARRSPELCSALPRFLGLSASKLASAMRHAGRAAAGEDDRLRAWFSPNLTEALLFSCRGGSVRPDLPVAALRLRPDAASPAALRAASRVERGLLPRVPPADEALSPAHCWRHAAASEGGCGLRLVVGGAGGGGDGGGDGGGGRRVRFPGLAVSALYPVQDLSEAQRLDVERACNLAVDSWWSVGHPGWKVFSMGGTHVSGGMRERERESFFFFFFLPSLTLQNSPLLSLFLSLSLSFSLFLFSLSSFTPLPCHHPRPPPPPSSLCPPSSFLLLPQFTSVATVQCYLDSIGAGVPLPGPERFFGPLLPEERGLASQPSPATELNNNGGGGGGGGRGGDEPEPGSGEPNGGGGGGGGEGGRGGDEPQPGSGGDDSDEDSDDSDDDEEEDGAGGGGEGEAGGGGGAALAAAAVPRSRQLFPSPSVIFRNSATHSADIAQLASHAGFVDVPANLRSAVAAMNARRAQLQQAAGGNTNGCGDDDNADSDDGDDDFADDDDIGIDSDESDDESDDDDDGDHDGGAGRRQGRSLRVSGETIESLAALAALGMHLRGAEGSGGDAEARARLRDEALARLNAGNGPEAASAAAATAREHQHSRFFESLRVLVGSMTDTSPAPARCARVAECLGHLATLDVPSPPSLAVAASAAASASAAAAAAAASPPTPANRAPAVAAFKATDSDSDEAVDDDDDIAHLLADGRPPCFVVAAAAADGDDVSCAAGTARRVALAACFEVDDDCASS